MTIETWLFALALTLPIGLAAVSAGINAARASSYWTVALGVLALPLVLSPVLPQLAIQAPSVLEPLGQAFAGSGEGRPLTNITLPPTQAGIDETLALFGIWILGAIGRLGLEAWRSMKLASLTGQAEPADTALTAQVNRLAKRSGLALAGAYTHCGPTLVTGLVHPRLYLNASELATPALDQVIRHELAHLERRDVWVLSFARLLSIALWFNPFLFALEARRRLAAELDCDRRALAGLSEGRARSYARALLNAAGSNSGSSPVVGFGVAPRKAIEMRLMSALNPSPNPNKACSIAARVGVLAAVGLSLCSVQAAHATGGLAAPQFTEIVLEGRQTSDFGPRVIRGMDLPPFHGGHDIAAPLGTPVRAPAAGVILYAGNEFRGNSDWGYVVEIDHGAGWTTIYAHLSGALFGRGDRIEAGQIFATVGNTGLSLGPHLHVEVRENGERRDPADHLPGLARLSD